LLSLSSIELNLSVEPITLLTRFLLNATSLVESRLRALLFMRELSGLVRALPNPFKESE